MNASDSDVTRHSFCAQFCQGTQENPVSDVHVSPYHKASKCKIYTDTAFLCEKTLDHPFWKWWATDEQSTKLILTEGWGLWTIKLEHCNISTIP